MFVTVVSSDANDVRSMETVRQREPVTRVVHERPWTADLATETHERDRQLVVAEAIDAVAQTDPGIDVDVVTPACHGHPETYLYPRLERAFVDIEVSPLGRCDCASYVTRIQTGRQDGPKTDSDRRRSGQH